MDRYPYYEHHHGPGAFGWIFFALFLVTLALLAAAAIRWFLADRARPAQPALPGDDPLATLRMRYARGEIGRDDFLRANEDLGGPPPAAALPST